MALAQLILLVSATLSQQVVVGEKAAFVMDPGGGLAAVNLGSGRIAWRNKAAEVPLLVHGQQLLTGTVRPGAAPGLQLELLDVATGKVSKTLPLAPIGAAIPVGQHGGSSASLTAESEGDTAYVFWSWEMHHWGGARLTPEQQAAASRSGHGTIAVDLGAGTLLGAVDRAASKPAAIQGHPSADRRHLVVTETIPGRPLSYRVEFTSAETGQRVAGFVMPEPLGGFVIRASLVVYETGTIPPRLEARELRTGKRIFSQPVRDLVYRGAPPP